MGIHLLYNSCGVQAAFSIYLFPIEVTYGLIPVKTTKRPSSLIKGTFIWVQVSVGTEYQVIPCINREGGKVVGVRLE